MNIKQVLASALLVLTTLIIQTSCNSKSDPSDPYEILTNVGVSKFQIKNDSKVLANLDSVFFSIDLEHGLIFNADSLPKGTPIETLIPVITYDKTISSATITMEGGKHRTGVVDYKKNPNDSIDFSGKVTLTLVAQDGVTRRDYLLKVNVHKMKPDSLWWDKMAVTELPSRFEAPRNQRSITYKERVLTLIQEHDNTYTIAATKNPSTNIWTKEIVDFGFTPNLRSLTSTDDSLYILSNNGTLYKSTDALNWTSTNENWEAILGGYQSTLLGIRSSNGKYFHSYYPQNTTMTETEIDSQFPIEGYSSFFTFTNKWSSVPTGLLVGGRTITGELIGNTWGFDGEKWAEISAGSHSAPPLRGATLIPYYIFKKTSTMWVQSKFSIWMLFGGHKNDGTLNNEIYITYDNGVNWFKGGELLQMPDYIPAMINADNAVIDTPMTTNFKPQGWEDKASKKLAPWYRVSDYKVDGYNVSWNCPYIYLFGGEDQTGTLNNTIWKGVLNRLTFAPLM